MKKGERRKGRREDEEAGQRVSEVVMRDEGSSRMKRRERRKGAKEGTKGG